MAYQTILDNKELLELIKTLLLEKETIIAEEINYIAQNLKLPPKETKEEIEQEKDLDLDFLIKESKSENQKEKIIMIYIFIL